MTMLAHFNGRERTAQAFKALFTKAHPSFQVTSVFRPKGSNMNVIEAMWSS